MPQQMHQAKKKSMTSRVMRAEVILMVLLVNWRHRVTWKSSSSFLIILQSMALKMLPEKSVRKLTKSRTSVLTCRRTS